MRMDIGAERAKSASVARMSQQKEVRKAKAAEREEAKLKEKEQALRNKRDRALGFIANIGKTVEEEGLGFEGLLDFVDSLDIPGGDPQARANITRLHKARAATIIGKVLNDAPKAIPEVLHNILAKEGQALQSLLTRDKDTGVSDLLESFSMESLTQQIQKIAPNLWATLETVSENPKSSVRRDSSLVSICSLEDFRNLLTLS